MGVNDALRLAAWLTVGGGGGIVGGVDLGWVLTSAGEIWHRSSLLSCATCGGHDIYSFRAFYAQQK